MSLRTFSRPATECATRLHDGHRAWLIGAGLAVLAHLFWLGGYITWFLGALCHEMGHTFAALATGCPAFPAIRLDGHAVTMLNDQILPLALLMIGGVAWWCWNARDNRTLLVLRALLLVPLLIALMSKNARDMLILYAGQGGELAFAGVFLWRAYTGGFTQTNGERPLYAMLGWVFVFENLMLAGGLMFSSAARNEYLGNGSFGVQNDLVRIANDHLGTGLPGAAVPLLFLAIATPLAAWKLGRLARD